jgi:molybdenum cofactor cytidylyltransferase
MTAPLLVLAAGSSRRYGSDKLGEVVAAQTVLDWTLQLARATLGEDHRILVVERTADSRAAQCARWQATPVVSPDAEKGMAYSLQAGLDAAGDAARVLVLLGDAPLAARALRAVLDEASGTEDRCVAVRREPFLPHPVLLPRRLWADLHPEKGNPDHGFGEVIRHADTLWVDGSQLPAYGVDAPGDLTRLAADLAALDLSAGR